MEVSVIRPHEQAHLLQLAGISKHLRYLEQRVEHLRSLGGEYETHLEEVEDEIRRYREQILASRPWLRNLLSREEVAQWINGWEDTLRESADPEEAILVEVRLQKIAQRGGIVTVLRSLIEPAPADANPGRVVADEYCLGKVAEMIIDQLLCVAFIGFCIVGAIDLWQASEVCFE